MIDLGGAQWRKSSRSGPNCDNCVEVALVDGAKDGEFDIH